MKTIISAIQESFYPGGQVESQFWWLNGEYHNENGPAVIWYHKNGQISSKRWFLNNKEYTEEEFRKYKLIKEMAGLK